MRKIGLYITFALALLPSLCFAQGHFYTTKERLQDYGSKITKVVLPGNIVLDRLLQQGVSELWQVTPYEFCTEQEYEALKSKPQYFFLRMVTLQDSGKKDSGVVCLSLSKGGGKNRESRDAAAHFLNVPVMSSAAMVTALDEACFPAYLSIVQQYIIDGAESERIANVGLLSYSGKILKSRHFNISFDERESIAMLQNSTLGGAVAVVVQPSDASSESYYYHYVIGTEDKALYFYSRKKNAPEFTPFELKLLKKE